MPSLPVKKVWHFPNDYCDIIVLGTGKVGRWGHWMHLSYFSFTKFRCSFIFGNFGGQWSESPKRHQLNEKIICIEWSLAAEILNALKICKITVHAFSDVSGSISLSPAVLFVLFISMHSDLGTGEKNSHALLLLVWLKHMGYSRHWCELHLRNLQKAANI